MVVGLSPMDGVTDVVMRYMSAKYGKPDLVITEFVSVDALAHAKDIQAVERIMKAFLRAKDIEGIDEKPLDYQGYEIAQVFGHTPELFYQAAVMIAILGYDGMDINMGCPMHKVEDQGSGAGLIRTPEIAKEIVRQSKQAMEDFADGKVGVEDLQMSSAIKEWVKAHAHPANPRKVLPVSVKTRIGVDHEVVEEWMEHLMQVQPANISLHGRTLRQLYQGRADWEAIGKAATVVHKHNGHLLGNGDVESLADAETKVKQYGVDGVLIGRFAEGNPGVFAGNNEPTVEQRMEWMIEHTKLYEKVYMPSEHNESDVRWFMPLRKHLAWYCKGFPGATEMRVKLMQSNSAQEVISIVKT